MSTIPRQVPAHNYPPGAFGPQRNINNPTAYGGQVGSPPFLATLSPVDIHFVPLANPNDALNHPGPYYFCTEFVLADNSHTPKSLQTKVHARFPYNDATASVEVNAADAARIKAMVVFYSVEGTNFYRVLQGQEHRTPTANGGVRIQTTLDLTKPLALGEVFDGLMSNYQGGFATPVFASHGGNGEALFDAFRDPIPNHFMFTRFGYVNTPPSSYLPRTQGSQSDSWTDPSRDPWAVMYGAR